MVTFELSQTQRALRRVSTTPPYTHTPTSDGLRPAAEQQAAQRDECHQLEARSQLYKSKLNKSTMGSYVVGSALTTKLPSFSGTGDWCAYLRTFERLAKAHTIPGPSWSNELFIKLEWTARNRYEQTFQDQDSFLSLSRRRDVWARMPRTAGVRAPHRCDGGPGREGHVF